MGAILEPISKSHSLGIAVPEAFSAKIQRRLASTMPPRAIVQLSFDETYANLKRLIADGQEVTDVLDYSDSQSLLVSRPSLFATDAERKLATPPC